MILYYQVKMQCLKYFNNLLNIITNNIDQFFHKDKK